MRSTLRERPQGVREGASGGTATRRGESCAEHGAGGRLLTLIVP